MSAHAIFAQGLTYLYPDGTRALDSLDFELAPGECVGLVGPSGAGKSTLALCLMGLIFPKSGSISLAGTQLTKKSAAQLRSKINLIFQNPDDQLFMPTLFEDVAFGLLKQGLPAEEVETRVKHALAERGLSGLDSKFPGHLSQGQKRLAALAGVLVMEPEILILDEPSSNLDPRSRRNLINQLGRLQNTRLIASHDLEMILDLCSRVILLSAGKIIASGGPAAILADRDLMEAHGLETPHSLAAHHHQHHDRPSQPPR